MGEPASGRSVEARMVLGMTVSSTVAGEMPRVVWDGRYWDRVAVTVTDWPATRGSMWRWAQPVSLVSA